MSNNTFWVIFWIIIIAYFLVDSYFDNKTKQIEIETNYKITKMKLEQDEKLRTSMEELVKLSNDLSSK